VPARTRLPSRRSGNLSVMMPLVTPPPDPISLRIPDADAAENIIRKLREAGIEAEQISLAHQNSAVLSAANNPTTYRATGLVDDPDRERPLVEPGFYVRSQAEHESEETAVLVTIEARPGQVDVIEAVLSGERVERIYPRYRRQYMPGNVAETPELYPHERAGNNPDLWWRLRQRVRFMPLWVKAAMLVGAGLALGTTFGRERREPRRRTTDVGTTHRLKRPA
jgi:hypothetical protein